jgi:hypothetical protein
VPKCTPDSLEISVIKIESLKGLNQLKPRTKKYYNYSNYTSITYTTLGHFYRPNRWHSAQESKLLLISFSLALFYDKLELLLRDMIFF